MDKDAQMHACTDSDYQMEKDNNNGLLVGWLECIEEGHLFFGH